MNWIFFFFLYNQSGISFLLAKEKARVLIVLQISAKVASALLCWHQTIESPLTKKPSLHQKCFH